MNCWVDGTHSDTGQVVVNKGVNANLEVASMEDMYGVESPNTGTPE